MFYANFPVYSHYGSNKIHYTNPYIIYNQIPVYLGGKAGTEKIVLYSSTTGHKAKVEIQLYHEDTGLWTVAYKKEAEGIPFFFVMTGYCETIKSNVVILYSFTENNKFLTYTIIGSKKGNIVELAERKNIYKGYLWFEGGNLVQAQGNKFKVWKIDKNNLVLVPYNIPRIPGALIIEYSITKNGQIRVRRKHYRVPIGSTVQIIRKDLNEVTDRILYKYTPIIKHIEHRSAFKILDKGNIELNIIPEKYEQQNTIKITIEAK